MVYVYAFDIDGTLTPIRSSWRYVHIVLGSRYRSKNYAKYFFERFISYDEWITLELSLFKGIKLKTFKAIISTIPWRYGIEELIKFRRNKSKEFFIAITGGFSYLGERTLSELGFNSFIGIELEICNGVLTGDVKSYIDFDGKGEILINFLYANKIEFNKLICIGDDVNDLGMFKYCNISIAFCPTEKLKQNDVDIYINSCDIRKLVEALYTIT